MIGYLGLPSLRKSGYRLRNVSFKQLGFCFCSIKLKHVFFAAIYTMCNMHTFFMQSTVMFVQRTERYSTVEKECLAIKLAVQAFKVYMLDHLKEDNARITWWSLCNLMCIQYATALAKRMEMQMPSLVPRQTSLM